MHEIHSVHLSCLSSPLKVLELFPAVVIYSHLQVMSLFQYTEPCSRDTEVPSGYEACLPARRLSEKLCYQRRHSLMVWTILLMETQMGCPGTRLFLVDSGPGMWSCTHFLAIFQDGEAKRFKHAQQNFMNKDWLLEIVKDFCRLINLKLEEMEAVNYISTTGRGAYPAGNVES